jgi:alpha-tubulin suppressor-like RCC1 family protein
LVICDTNFSPNLEAHMKFRTIFSLVVAGLLSACQTTPSKEISNPTQALGVLELSLNSDGLSTARLASGLRSQTTSFREPDIVIGTGSTNVITSTNDPFDYLVATFPVSHVVGSGTAFQNLTLYALAKNGNVGGTAIKSITNFGGATGGEQTRLAKLLIPSHAVQVISGNVVMDNSNADFQAFNATEVMAATTAASALLVAGDTILNYGFSARCLTICTANSRIIPTNGTGNLTITIRVPKTGTYKFIMNFVVMDEDVSRVTRGIYPPESISDAQTRGTSVNAAELMQFGLNQGITTLTSKSVDDVRTSTLGASIQALGIGRIAAGTAHSCGLTSVGTAYCWGNNTVGQLGNGAGGTGITSNVPVAVVAPSGGSVLSFSSIIVGQQHACGLTSSGSAYCWGNNTVGQLGNGAGGTGITSNVPVAVVAPSGGSVLSFSSISGGGGSHICGLTSSGSAYCWGNNVNGQLGNGASGAGVTSNVPVAVVAPSGGSVLSFSSIGIGVNHSCGLTTSGSAYCWGNNGLGRLGNGTVANSSIPVAVVAPSGGSVLIFSSIIGATAHTCGLTTSGSAYCWGINTNGQLGDGTVANSSTPVAVSGSLKFSSISTFGVSTCGVITSGDGYCWGSNAFGQLGNGAGGTGITSNVPVAVVAPSGGSVLSFSSITTGGSHACGLTTSGIAYCWGNNPVGQLGNGAGGTGVISNVPVAVVSTFFNL